MNETNSDTTDAIERVFRGACRTVVACWLLAAFAVLPASFLLPPEYRQATIVITLVSGVLAAVALQSGILLPRLWTAVSLRRHSSPMRQFLAGAASVMALRIVGTVALFLTCRYHLSASAETIVGLTILWYVLLTAIEVIALGREMSRFAPTKLTSHVIDRSTFIA